MSTQLRTSRFSGAEWGDQLKSISLVGCGGINSWVALNLSRIGHQLVIFDGDNVDSTNVHGGQMFRTSDIGSSKVVAIHQICRQFGTIAPIDIIDAMYHKGDGLDPITVTGLDNMAARKLVFGDWLEGNKDNPDAILIDGRLLMENMEILAVQMSKPEQIAKYREEFLFDDSEVPDLDCTTKQSTFSAMIIAGLITATLCNFLTNKKLGVEMREIPFHQKMYLPIFKHDVVNLEPRNGTENTPVSIPEIIGIPEEESLVEI